MNVLLRTAALSCFVLLTGAQPSTAQGPSGPAPASGEERDHADHGATEQLPSQPASGGEPDHSTHSAPAAQPPYPAGVPPVTDEDRAAAFPLLEGGHAVHDDAVHYYVLFDQLEWQGANGSAAGTWDSRGWIGRDLNRFWFRTEGEAEHGDLGEAQAHALFGRAVHRWWDVVAGISHDFRPGPSRTWAAVGIQGLAPYWFDIEATAYVGAAWRTHVRLETEYELLLTNRLILQPLVEVEIHGKSDPERGLGAGLSSAETGVRLRYEFRREFAPYVGLTWDRLFFGTADHARQAGEEAGRGRLAIGLRAWF